MPKPARNQGEILYGTVKLENREYRAAELIKIVGRNKRRILALAEEMGIGRKVDPLNCGDWTRVFAKWEVEKMLKWFDSHGRKHFEAPWTEVKKPAKRQKRQAV